MSHDPQLDDLAAPFGPDAIKTALSEAFRRGEESMRSKMLAALGAAGVVGGPDATPTGATPALAPLSNSPHDDSADNAEGQTRAPRGLTREVIDMILADGASLGTAEIQRMASDLDERVSPKTVYNELNRGRDKLYRLSMGRWRLIKQVGGVSTPDDMEAWIGASRPA